MDINQHISITLSRAWGESDAFDETPVASSTTFQIVKFLLTVSTHKTYQYILVNGLLGACVGLNPLVLQAQSRLKNAWDARSVCHKILVPFERAYMQSKLGGSNEPFLNKPARFTELSINNAVRAGRDKEALVKLIRLFSDRNIHAESYRLLVYALSLVRKKEVAQVVPRSNIATSGQLPLREILELSCEGESLLFVAGLILQCLNPALNVVCHKSNQSGASSNEVGDVDLFEGQNIVSSVEVKDKPFSFPDYQHAKRKANEAGVNRFLFVSRKAYIDQACVHAQNMEALVSIESLIQIAEAINFNFPNFNVTKFCDSFVKHACPKHETLAHIQAHLA